MIPWFQDVLSLCQAQARNLFTGSLSKGPHACLHLCQQLYAARGHDSDKEGACFSPPVSVPSGIVVASRCVLPCSDVEAIDAEDKQDLAAFPFDKEAEFRGLGDALPVGEKGFTTLERRCITPHACLMWLGMQVQNVAAAERATWDVPAAVLCSVNLAVSASSQLFCRSCVCLCVMCCLAAWPSSRQWVSSLLLLLSVLLYYLIG